MSGDLDEISQAIGGLQAQGTEHGRQIGAIFSKLNDIHSAVQSGQTDHHDRISSLEVCSDGVDNNIKPALKTMATEIHQIKEGIFKSKIKLLAAALGVTTTGGGFGAIISKWMS